jgi:hypothetical protein
MRPRILILVGIAVALGEASRVMRRAGRNRRREPLVWPGAWQPGDARPGWY